MVVFSASRRPLVALALLSSAFAVSASPASARSHHGAYRHTHARHAYRHMPQRFAGQPFARPQFFSQSSYPQAASYPQTISYPQAASRPRIAYRPRMEHRHVEQSVALARLRKYADRQASVTPYEPGGGMVTSGSSPGLVMEARQFLGTKPGGMGGSLWCARFMNMVLEKTGHQGTGSAMASSFASYGHRVSGPEIGAIAVMGRRGGGHVGIITGIDASGNPIMISGNNGNRVREAPISRGRIYAYVMPN
ncbi:MAG: TIGR02594 family protein [Bradyrhizobium sp.]|nr:TIGR02594 family protein [Bradyrhizobium sp.]